MIQCDRRPLLGPHRSLLAARRCPLRSPYRARASRRSRLFIATLSKTHIPLFWERVNRANASCRPLADARFSSIAAVGSALRSIRWGRARVGLPRRGARTHADDPALLLDATPGPTVLGVTGHAGFFYHFLDMETGLRFATLSCPCRHHHPPHGMLFAREYFDADHRRKRSPAPCRCDLRTRDWNFFRSDGRGQCRWACTPKGPDRAQWDGYNEGMFVYLLASRAEASFAGRKLEQWTAPYPKFWRGGDYSATSPSHRVRPPDSHIGIDFRGILDARCRRRLRRLFRKQPPGRHSQTAPIASPPECSGTVIRRISGG